MIRGVILDMDGLLLDTEKLYFRYWRQSAAEFGFDMQPEHALAVRSCCQTYAEPYLKRVLGANFDYIAVRNRRRELVEAHIQQHGITPKPGIRELTDYCKKAGIRPAVATATARSLAEERLQIAGLNGIFSDIIGGDEVPVGKPHPGIYQKAAAALELPPAACLALEDSPNGIAAAFAAGCKPVMIPDLTQPAHCIQPLLYAVADSLTDVIRILQSANGTA